MGSYDFWIKQVDALLVRKIGLGHDDMEAWAWRDAFEDGYTPAEAIEDYLEWVDY